MEDIADDPHLPVTAESLPSTVLTEFPRLETLAANDPDVVARQLGRPPQGLVLVARRCRRGRPAVVLTVPLAGKGKPTPPLLWLSCPRLVGEVGGLESGGMVRTFVYRLDDGGEAAWTFREDENRFSRMLFNLFALEFGRDAAEKLGPRGVAGGRVGSVKCLHAHLAYRLASGRGIPGTWVMEELQARGKGVWCDRPSQACVG